MIGWAGIRREPYRLFFPFGVLFGLLGVNHWLAYAFGWSGSYSGFYHAGIQVGGYMMGFIIGFLLTALPRFSATSPSTTMELAAFLALYLAQPLLLSLGCWDVAQAAFVLLLLLLALFAGRRFAAHRAQVAPPTEFVWVGVAILHGLAGSWLLMAARSGWIPAGWLGVGRPMVQQGFLLSIVLGVGGFMSPRLMGRTTLQVTPAGVDAAMTRRVRRRRLFVHVLAGLALFVSFFIEGRGAFVEAYALRAAIVTAELVWTTQFLTPPRVTDLYVRFVWLSLWLIVGGLWGAACLIRFRVAMLHVVFLGGLSLMTFAVATMVVLSHAGEGQRLRQPLWVLNVVGTGLVAALAARLAAEGLPGRYFLFLGAAAACWSLAGISWLFFAVPHLLRPVSEDAFDRAHETAKRELVHSVAPSGSRC